MDAKVATFVGGFFLIISMFSLFVGGYFYDTRNARRRTRRNKGAQVPAQPEFLAAADTTRKLPPVAAANHFPSVKEETTHRLDASRTVENRGKGKTKI